MLYTRNFKAEQLGLAKGSAASAFARSVPVSGSEAAIIHQAGLETTASQSCSAATGCQFTFVSERFKPSTSCMRHCSNAATYAAGYR